MRLVPAVDRAVRILDALSCSPEPLSLADLARSLELPRSSLHGLLATLVHLDLARRDDDARFRPGARPIDWARAWNGQAEVVAAFERQATRIAALTAETVMLAALDGFEVVYLACRPGQRALEINFRVGGRLPAAIASSGKAMLATLSDTQVREQLGGHVFPKTTRHSVSGLTALIRQLQKVRLDGYAIDDEEAAEGMQCFGAAIRTDDGTPSARHAVAVSVIKAGLAPRRKRELIQAVQALAAEIEQALQINRVSAAGAQAQARQPARRSTTLL